MSNPDQNAPRCRDERCRGGRVYTGIDGMKWVPCPACGAAEILRRTGDTLPVGCRFVVVGVMSHGRSYVGLRGIVLARDEGLIDVRLDDGLRATFFEQDLQPDAHEHH